MVLKFKKGKTMKRLMFIFVIVLVLCAPTHAITYTAFDKATFDNSYQWSGHSTKDRATQWAQDIEGLVTAGIRLGTGKIWYVDSGSGRSASGDGTSWTRAFLTGDEAFDSGKATADRGDIVKFAQGHNEALTAGGVTVDVAGVTLVGCGNGTLMPTFDYDVGSGTFIISAANVAISNMRFRASVTTIVSGLHISGDDVTVAGCKFGFAETAPIDEFTTAVSVFGNSTLIQNCYFDAGNASAARAIYVGAVSNFVLQDTDIIGDYSTACVENPTVYPAFYVRMRRNLLFNGTMSTDGEINTVAAIVMAEGTGGYIADNRIVADTTTAALMRVGDDMVFMNNFVSDTDGDEFSGTPESGVIYSTLPANRETDTTSISGHIDG